MSITFYNSYKVDALNAAINLASDTIKCAFLTSAYTPSQDNDDFWDDVSANEVTPSGTYAEGGVTLTNKAVTKDNTDNEGVFDCDDISVTGATITARYAVFYKDTGTPSTSKLICYDDFGSDKISTVGTFTYAIAAEGLINVN